MKICYISVCRDGTGYGIAAINTMMACKQVGIDVVSRPVTLTPIKGKDSYNRVAHLEQKDTNNVNAVIQHILPSFFEYKNEVKNIGYFHYETNHFKNSGWIQQINLMDEIWVTSIQAKQAVIDSGVKKSIYIVPCCINYKKYGQQFEPLQIPINKPRCIFYTIGEFNRRKNILALVRAYYQAFTGNDSTLLIIKTNTSGINNNQTSQYITNLINGVKDKVKLACHPKLYPPIALDISYKSEKEIYRLHKTGSVYVTSTCGEAGALPLMDAMGFGNPIIGSNWGNIPELLYGQAQSYFDPKTQLFKHPGEIKTGWLTPGSLTSCFGMETINGLYLGNELWFDVNIPILARQMQEAYKLWQQDKLKEKGIAATNRIKNFDYSIIGEIIKNRLEDNNA